MKDLFMCLLALACIGIGYVALEQREAYLEERRTVDRLTDKVLEKSREIARLEKDLRNRPVIFKKRIVRD